MIVKVDYQCFTSMGNESFNCNFYIKLAADDELSHQIGVESRLMEREVSTYLRILPRMKLLLGDRWPYIPFSEPVYGAFKASGDGILVANEDSSFTCLDNTENVSLKKIQLILNKIAKYQAATLSFISREGIENVKKEFSHLDGSIYNNDASFNFVNRQLQVKV